MTGAAAISFQPYSITNRAGTTATFSVTAGGTEPLSYQWLKDGTPLADAGTIAGALTSTLSVSNVVKHDEGAYRVVVANAGGSVTSTVVALTVIEPGITHHPVGQTREPGENVSFNVTPAGTPPFNYQWWKDGEPLGQATEATLTLTNLQISDAGNYSVVVGNSYGSVTSKVALLIVSSAHVDPDFNPGADGEVFTLAVQLDRKIVVGGYFTNLAGQSRSSIGRLNADGTPDSQFNANADVGGLVFSTALQADGKLLVQGFLTVNGQYAGTLARLNTDGTPDTEFIPEITAGHQSLALQSDGRIVAGYYHIDRLHPDGTLDVGFNAVAVQVQDRATLRRLRFAVPRGADALDLNLFAG